MATTDPVPDGPSLGATRQDTGRGSVEFPTSITDEALASFELRDQAAATAAIKRFLSPSSVAVIGASRGRMTIGGEIFHSLLATASTDPSIRASTDPSIR